MSDVGKERFDIIRPDEFAECRDGVSAVPGLYEKLWSFVQDYKAPSPEESEEPCYGRDSLAGFWDRLSPEEQAAIEAIEDRKESEERAMMRRYYEERRQPVPAQYLEPEEAAK